MPFVILALLIFVPIVELAVIIKVGGAIGVVPTILLIVSMAVLGTILLRQQGLAVLRRSQTALAAGQLPVGSALDGFGLILAAILMITPGFLTDIVGVLLLVPAIRRNVGAWVIARVVAKGTVRFRSPRRHERGERPSRDGKVIDGDYERIDEP